MRATHWAGRKIERILLRFVGDSNTAIANLLAGDAQVATDAAIPQVTDALKGEWMQQRGGRVVHWPNTWRSTTVQHRPDLASPPGILDARVRKSLAHTIDKASINETVLGGDGILSETMIWSKSEWGAATNGLDATFSYDPRRAEQLMGEAGFQKGPDGTYAGPGGRFTGGLRTTAGADFEQEMLIMADGWRRVGFDIQESVVPAAQAQDNQVRATFPTLFTGNTNMGEPALLNYTTSGIPRPENRWNGGNRGGWSNAAYDRLADEFNRTLARPERVQQVAEMLRIYVEELPSISLFFRAQPLAHVAGLRGPATAAPESSLIWNIHEWEYQ